MISGAFTIVNAGIGWAVWRAQERIRRRNDDALAAHRAELDRQLVAYKAHLDEKQVAFKAELDQRSQLTKALIDQALNEATATLAHEREYRQKVEGVLAQLLTRANRARSTFTRLVNRLQLDSPMDDGEYLELAARGLADLSEFLASASTHDGIVLPARIGVQIRTIRSNCTKLFLELSSRHTEHEKNLDVINSAFQETSASVDALERDIREFLGVP